MATKTFKIGEYAKGGVITVNVTKDSITVIGKDWDYSKGSNRGSDQSGAKEFDRKEFDLSDRNLYRGLLMYLGDLTTSYYSDNIIEWIGTKVGKNLKQLFW